MKFTPTSLATLPLLAAACFGGNEDSECDPGFALVDGECADIDECAANLHDCSPDATCANTEGAFECACVDGFDGNGQNCSDIDECAARTDNCDDNATCANAPGGFFCDCNEGFTGNGTSCRGTADYGEFCDDPVICDSGICLSAPFEHCTVQCDQTVANSCGAIGAAGLCVDASGETLCAGSLDFGLDNDDEIMTPGDSVSRDLSAIGDLDVFQFTLAEGEYTFTATPEQADDDLQMEFFGHVAQPVGTANNAGPGGAETANFTQIGGTGVIFVVIRNIGNSTGPYQLTSAEL